MSRFPLKGGIRESEVILHSLLWNTVMLKEFYILTFSFPDK